jgi:hypothetical protein
MNLKMLGGGAVLALAAFAATAANAADPKKGTYEQTGIIFGASSGCAPIAAGLPPAGSPALATIIYPGEKGKVKTMSTVSPQTPASGAAGSTISSVCVNTAAIPATGLNGNTIPVDCSQDNLSGPQSPGHYSITYTVAATAIPTSWTVTSALDLSSAFGAPPFTCVLTTSGTWAAE